MIVYANPVLYVFIATFTALILLALITFSVPFISNLYFLYSTQANGVRFGIWGWCLDEYETCSSPLQLGYAWEPQITGVITNALVFYPITLVVVALTVISAIPVLCARTIRNDRIFTYFAWASFASSTFAFLFMIGMWSVAKARFEKRGFAAHYGPLPWMSLAATFLLLVVALSPYFIEPPPIPKSRRRRRTQQPQRTRRTQRRALAPDVEARPSKRAERPRGTSEKK